MGQQKRVCHTNQPFFSVARPVDPKLHINSSTSFKLASLLHQYLLEQVMQTPHRYLIFGIGINRSSTEWAKLCRMKDIRQYP